jgi:hypothetical protein
MCGCDDEHRLGRYCRVLLPRTPSLYPSLSASLLQGDDPLTDLRGAGLAGLTYLTRLVEAFKEARASGLVMLPRPSSGLMTRTYLQAIGAYPSQEMPLAIGALNVHFALCCHLQVICLNRARRRHT